MQDKRNEEEKLGSRSDEGFREIPSSAQQRLWFLDKLMGPSSVYNIPRLLWLSGQLDVEALHKSLNEIVRRHEALRANFHEKQGEPVARIGDRLTLDLPMISLEHIAESKRESTAMRLAHEEGEIPFDLETDPLIRVTLVNLGPEKHILILTIHHIVFDGWSQGIFNHELSILYSAFKSGGVSPLQELSTQYFEYATRQRDWIAGVESEKEMSFWKRQLADLPTMDFPTDHPRPKVSSYRGGSVEIRLSAELTNQLDALARKNNVTLYILLLSAFNALLYRYTNQNDIVVGSPIAGRMRTDLEQIIGFFVNTLVLRTDLSGNPRFDELLARVTDVFWDSLSYQELPFEKLVEVLQPERELGINPLFQILFVLQSETNDGLKLEGLEVEDLPTQVSTAMMDLALSVRKQRGTLKIKATYASDFFNKSTMERMLGHYQKLLEEITDDPNKTISDLAVLTESEEQLMLVEWNNTAKDYPKNLCAHHLFEKQARSTPDNVALVFEGRYMSYGKLEEEANRMANHLATLGVGPEDLVGVCIERSMEMVVAILGILKAGGAYVPLDPTYPSERLTWMVKDARPKVIVGKERWMGVLAETGVALVYVEDGAITKASTECPESGAVPENLAYVIYTSGSTGMAKGVMVPHRAVINHVWWRRNFMGLSEEDRVLQKSSLSFDVSVLEIFGPLSSGARVVLAEPDHLQDTACLTELIAKEGVTTMSLVPSQLRGLLNDPGIANCRSLRLVNCGGEVMPADLPQLLFARLAAKLYNNYGPTETTVAVTSWECQRGSDHAITPIGKPIANTGIYLLDEHGQPVPIGVTGEIHIGGHSVARGYLNREELTKERFLPHPFGDPGQKIYRTGDLGRYLPDGNLVFLGRVDRQVKLRGLRIELGEIEARLLQINGVREAVAYVVFEHGSPLDERNLRSTLEKHLPAAMIPGAIVKLNKLPLTLNGKLDLEALQIPSREDTNYENAFAAPRSPLEERLGAIWSEVLRVEKVGVHEDFFQLGGHSLHAMRLRSRIRVEFEVEIPVSVIFENSTIAQLGKSIEEALATLTRPSSRANPEKIVDQ